MYKTDPSGEPDWVRGSENLPKKSKLTNVGRNSRHLKQKPQIHTGGKHQASQQIIAKDSERYQESDALIIVDLFTNNNHGYSGRPKNKSYFAIKGKLWIISKVTTR